jgi:hypothetical protein
MGTPNIRKQHRKRNKPRKPKYHRQTLRSQNPKLVRSGRETGWCEDQVGKCEERPDAAEEEEVRFGGGPVPESAVPGIDDWRLLVGFVLRERGGNGP